MMRQIYSQSSVIKKTDNQKDKSQSSRQRKGKQTDRYRQPQCSQTWSRSVKIRYPKSTRPGCQQAIPRDLHLHADSSRAIFIGSYFCCQSIHPHCWQHSDRLCSFVVNQSTHTAGSMVTGCVLLLSINPPTLLAAW